MGPIKWDPIARLSADDNIDYGSLLDELPWDHESLERPDDAPSEVAWYRYPLR